MRWSCKGGFRRTFFEELCMDSTQEQTAATGGRKDVCCKDTVCGFMSCLKCSSHLCLVYISNKPI